MAYTFHKTLCFILTSKKKKILTLQLQKQATAWTRTLYLAIFMYSLQCQFVGQEIKITGKWKESACLRKQHPCDHADVLLAEIFLLHDVCWFHIFDYIFENNIPQNTIIGNIVLIKDVWQILIIPLNFI